VFGVCPSNKHCPPARCAYAANMVDKDLDIFAIEAAQSYLVIFYIKLLIIFKALILNPNFLMLYSSQLLSSWCISHHICFCLFTSPELVRFLLRCLHVICLLSSSCVGP
jgi:hypothetical protein